MQLRIHTLGNNNLFKYVIANYLGVNPEIGRHSLCKMLKSKGITIVVANIFEDWVSYPKESFKLQDRRGFDLGLLHLRILKKEKVNVEFEASQSMNVDIDILRKVSPPLYDYFLASINNKKQPEVHTSG